jgi:hypothetical protein
LPRRGHACANGNIDKRNACSAKDVKTFSKRCDDQQRSTPARRRFGMVCISQN